MAKRPAIKKVDVGLDLTSNEVRCVSLQRRGKEVTLERFAIGEIPSSVFAAGRVAEPAELGAHIRKLLHEQGVSARRAIVSRHSSVGSPWLSGVSLVQSSLGSPVLMPEAMCEGRSRPEPWPMASRI